MHAHHGFYHSPPHWTPTPYSFSMSSSRMRTEVPRDQMWQQEAALSQDDRRARYHCGNRYMRVSDIATWAEYADDRELEQDPDPSYAYDAELNSKVSLKQCNIVTMELDAILNAANSRLLGGGGIDGAIHSAAGDSLYEECLQLNGARTGETKITRGYDLPAKYVLHTVGPIGEDPEALERCYTSALNLMLQYNLRTIGLCCVSTGIFGYPLYSASHIALRVVREWLMTGDNRHKVDRIVFVTFLGKEVTCYEELMPLYFPIDPTVDFIWRWEGHHVQVAGDFSEWKPLNMYRWDNAWRHHLRLNPGTYHFKFIVDGVWKHDGQQLTSTDSSGNVNNVIVVEGRCDDACASAAAAVASPLPSAGSPPLHSALSSTSTSVSSLPGNSPRRALPRRASTVTFADMLPTAGSSTSTTPSTSTSTSTATTTTTSSTTASSSDGAGAAAIVAGVEHLTLSGSPPANAAEPSS